MKYLVDTAAVSRASGGTARAARMLERLIASFRTAEERNTAERARIQALEAKVAGLEQRVTALEAP